MDSTSQALHWIREQGEAGGLFEFYWREFEAQRARAEDLKVVLGFRTEEATFSCGMVQA